MVSFSGRFDGFSDPNGIRSLEVRNLVFLRGLDHDLKRCFRDRLPPSRELSVHGWCQLMEVRMYKARSLLKPYSDVSPNVVGNDTVTRHSSRNQVY